MNTLVISNIHRESLITPHIVHMNPIVALTPDYPYPAIGHFRCWHGHTNALQAYMTDETALVFEDDCKPDNTWLWQHAITAANRLVIENGYDMVCLHGRGFDFSKFDKFTAHGHDWLRPITRDRWVLGTLAYVLNRKAAKQFIEADFFTHGTNIDIWLWSHRNHFVILDPRQYVSDKTLSETLIAENPGPFIHGHGAEGSVLQNPRNVHTVNR